MRDFFLQQIDYIYFIYGLAYIGLGAIALLLIKSQREFSLWKYFAVFGFSLGIYEWFDLISKNTTVGYSFKIIQVVVMIVSIVPLFEFGRRYAKANFCRYLGFWVYLPSILLVYFGWKFGGVTGFNATSRYFFGLLGGLGAIVALFGISKEIKNIFFDLFKFAFALFVISISFVPKSAFFPTSVVNQELFFDLTGIPVQFIRAILVILQAFSLWLFFCSTDLKRRLISSRHAYVVMGAYVVVLVSGWFFTDAMGVLAVKELNLNLLGNARIAASSIFADDIKNLSDSLTDQNIGVYDQLKARLVRANNSKPELRFTYLLGIKGSKIFVIADSEKADSPDYSPFGDSYDDAPKGAYESLLDKKELVFGPYTDRWGSWVTALVPIVDDEKNVVAALGMDIDSKSYSRLVYNYRFFGIAVSFALFIIVCGFFLSSQFRRISNLRLQESEERLRSVSEHSLVGYYIIQDGVFKYVNPAMCSMTGYSLDELIGLNPLDSIIHPDDKAVVEENIRKRMQRELATSHYEFRCIRKDKKIITVEVIGSLLNYDGKPAIMGNMLEITLRKVAEAEMKKAVAMREEFTSMVSHELRTPLGPIKEGVSIVLEGLAGPVSETQRDLLETVRRNADRLNRLINNVLDFQKLESGRMPFDMEENDLLSTVDEVVKTMSLVTKEKGLYLLVDAEKDIPKFVFDRDKIIQVLINFVNNSIKFTDEGGIKIIVKRSGDSIHVSVKDTGPGIGPEDIPRLFKSFQQLELARKKGAGGTGLGLAISKEIIIKHNGKIWVESELGYGTTFQFMIPIEQRRNS